MTRLGSGAVLAAQLCVLSACAVPGSFHAKSSGAQTDLTAAEITSRARELVSGADVAYVSDYFSFAGSDEEGTVAFALDTNRGREGRTFQADHFVTLYDEHQGWIPVEGYGRYDNSSGQILDLVDSPYFRFRGRPYDGLTASARTMPLELTIEPLVPWATRLNDTALFSMGSAGGVLHWRERRIHGRIIYEYLAIRGYDRLAKPSVASLVRRVTHSFDFQGLYLRGGPGDDVYVHASSAALAEKIGGPMLLFSVDDGHLRATSKPSLRITDSRMAPGFFRWPEGWTATWEEDGREVRMVAEAVDQQTEKTWVIGGFAIMAVRGELVRGGETTSLFGLAEVIR
jgi:hypothetical protein